MRNISQFAASMMLLATQAQVPSFGTADALPTSVSTSALEVKINMNTADPVQITGPKQPDFDNEVLAPLRTAQAQKAEAARVATAAAAARAMRTTTVAAPARSVATKTAPVVIGGSDAWAKLRLCEAGGNYATNTGNGFYGAYQFDIRTWANYGGYARPDLAPPAVQDAKAQATQAARGWSPWPSCARRLGLL